MADPTVIDCSAACTVTVVHELSLAPLQLDEAAGASIAGAIVLVWAAGWGFRQFVKLIQNTGSVEKDES